MVQPFGSARQEKTPAPSVSVMLVDGGPLGLKLTSSCATNPRSPQGSVTPTYTSYSPKMEIHISYGLEGKEVERVGDLSGDVLLDEARWGRTVEATIFNARQKLASRGLHVTDGVDAAIRSSLSSSRRESILMVVRALARALIRVLPAGDACQVWMEEEAMMILES